MAVSVISAVVFVLVIAIFLSHFTMYNVFAAALHIKFPPRWGKQQLMHMQFDALLAFDCAQRKLVGRTRLSRKLAFHSLDMELVCTEPSFFNYMKGMGVAAQKKLAKK